MTITTKRLVYIFLTLAINSGCTTAVLQKTKYQATELPQKVIDLRHTSTLRQLLPELAQQQVVLVGESHTNYGDHINQLHIIKALHAYWPDMGVGMEYVQSPFQKALDDYVAGKISDAQMLQQTQWYQRWGYDFRLYRDIFHYAKTNKIPLIALNAPRELTKKISRRGIAGLSAADRRYLPAQITRSKAYRARLTDVFEQHSRGSSKGLENFIDVQLGWDESMAANTVKALRSGKVRHMVLLAGAGHVLHQAIPVRLEKHGIRSMVIVSDFPEQLSEVDLVLPSSKKRLPKAGKIGVYLATANSGVLVAGLSTKHGSVLKKGDVIISINGKKTLTPDDIKIQLLDKKPGAIVNIEIQRQQHAKLPRSRASRPVTLHKKIKLH